MAKVKFSKTELKTQRDALKRFTRFLPTLQLKKQQLQAEVMRMHEEIETAEKELAEAMKQTKPWVKLFSTDEAEMIGEKVSIKETVLDTKNIAGVDIPVLEKVLFEKRDYDLFETSPWVDKGFEALEKLVHLRIGIKVLEEQRSRLEDELRTTTQRVNLFEKVKIPECKYNIRVIQIYLGDQQTAAVGRAKIAKNKLVALGEEEDQ